MVAFSDSLRAILLGLLAAAVVIILAFLAVLQLWEPRALENFLPAEKTVALFTNVSVDDLHEFSQAFPILQTMVGGFPQSAQIGIVQVNEKEVGVVLSSTSKDEPLPNANFSIGQQSFLITPNLKPLLIDTTENRLRVFPSFIDLHAGLNNDDAWIYWKVDDVAALLPTNVKKMIKIIDDIHGPVLLLRRGGTTALRVLHEAEKNLPQAEKMMRRMTPSPDVSLTNGNPRELLSQFLAQEPERRPIIEGILLQKIKDVLGGEWSLPYDILPLLGEPSTVHWKLSGNALSFLFDTHLANLTDAKTRVQALHDQFKKNLVGSVLVRHTLDKGQTSAVLKNDPELIDDHTETKNSWMVHVTQRKGSGAALISAIRGRQLLVSNQRSWMDQMLSQSGATLSLPSFNDEPLMGGSVEESVWKSLLKDQPSALWNFFTNALIKGKPVHWGIEQTGKILTLAISS